MRYFKRLIRLLAFSNDLMHGIAATLPVLVQHLGSMLQALSCALVSKLETRMNVPFCGVRYNIVSARRRSIIYDRYVPLL